MKKIIYVYHKKDSKDNHYKIGKADQRSDQTDDVTIDEIGSVRISEQLTAATYGDYKILQIFDISHVDSSTSVEHAIHTGIQKAGYKRLTRTIGDKKGTTEWFDFDDTTEGKVLECIKTLVEKHSGKSGLKKFIPRGYQSHIQNQIVEAVNSGAKVIGAELAARSGKTLTSLSTFKDFANQERFQYMFLPAYVLTAHSSFQKELRSFTDFDDILFISDKDSDFVDKIKSNKDKKLVIATSLHTPDDSLNKYDVVRELDKEKKIAFIDEADFGAHTESSKKRIDLLDVDVKVIMTGTAIERALAGYDVDTIIKWSYFDMLLLKDNNHPILEDLSDSERQHYVDTCAEIVIPNFVKMTMPNSPKIQEQLPDYLQTKWSKLLEDVDKNQFILQMIIKAMFKNDNSDIHELTSLSLSSVTPANVSMIFGLFKNKIQQNKFVKLTRAALGEDFVVLTINADETSNRQAEEDVQIVVAQAKRKGKRVIMVSKDMASRSFSIPEIDTVFLMYDNGLVSQTVQKSSRPLTPGKTYIGENKIEGTVVSLSLDSNRLEVDPIDLYIVAEANHINDADESMQDSVRRICNSANIFQNDLVEGMIRVEPDTYAEDLLKRSSVLKSIAAEMSIEQINIDDYQNPLLDNRSSNPNSTDENKVNVDTSSVRTSVEGKQTGDREPFTPSEQKQFIKNVIYLTHNITRLKTINNNVTSSIDTILPSISEKGLEHEVEEIYGLRYDVIEDLINNKKIPTRLLNTVLQSHKEEVIVF